MVGDLFPAITHEVIKLGRVHDDVSGANVVRVKHVLSVTCSHLGVGEEERRKGVSTVKEKGGREEERKRGREEKRKKEERKS